MSDQTKNETPQHRILKHFSYLHLPPELAAVSAIFLTAAHKVCEMTDPGPEQTVALRKLLEAKDAAVRAKVHPGG